MVVWEFPSSVTSIPYNKGVRMILAGGVLALVARLCMQCLFALIGVEIQNQYTWTWGWGSQGFIQNWLVSFKVTPLPPKKPERGRSQMKDLARHWAWAENLYLNTEVKGFSLVAGATALFLGVSVFHLAFSRLSTIFIPMELILSLS
jgi:hypothetical protein